MLKKEVFGISTETLYYSSPKTMTEFMAHLEKKYVGKVLTENTRLQLGAEIEGFIGRLIEWREISKEFGEDLYIFFDNYFNLE